MTAAGLLVGLGLVLPVVVDPGWLAIAVTQHSLHHDLGQSPIFGVLPGVLWQALYLVVVAGCCGDGIMPWPRAARAWSW